MFMFLAMAIANSPALTPKTEPEREVQLGSRLSKRVETAERGQQEVRKIQAIFGECVVKKHYTDARDFVLTADMSVSDYRKYAQKLADGVCLVAAASATSDIKMRLPGDAMRYALADALVKRE